MNARAEKSDGINQSTPHAGKVVCSLRRERAVAVKWHILMASTGFRCALLACNLQFMNIVLYLEYRLIILHTGYHTMDMDA